MSVIASALSRKSVFSGKSDALVAPPIPEPTAEPTPAQIHAGNYRKKHTRWRGLDISIENPRGSVRRGTNRRGESWERKLTADYGYIKRAFGADGDHLDVFVGPDLESDRVFVVNQVSPEDREFDEHKIVIGTPDEAAARALYQSNYDSRWRGLGSIVEMSVDELKEWIKTGDLREPVRNGLGGIVGLNRNTPAVVKSVIARRRKAEAFFSSCDRDEFSTKSGGDR